VSRIDACNRPRAGYYENRQDAKEERAMRDDAEIINTTILHHVGQDLSMLSLNDLDQRLEQLRAEIIRVTQMAEKKRQTQTAATALFKI
jgi:uncharacterized small protein (DUF1192 family)